MNKRIKHTVLAGATVATLGLGLMGASVASADSNAAGTSLVDKLATKFNLNRDEVAAVFTADRQEHQAQRQAEQAERLAQAVKDGKLTQTQADYIKNAQKELEALRDKAEPGQADDATRTAMREKMDALRDWAEKQNIDLQYVGPGGHGMGPGGPGGPNGSAAGDQSSSN